MENQLEDAEASIVERQESINKMIHQIDRIENRIVTLKQRCGLEEDISGQNTYYDSSILTLEKQIRKLKEELELLTEELIKQTIITTEQTQIITTLAI